MKPDTLPLPLPAVRHNWRLCACGCSAPVKGKALYDDAACRKRAERARRAAKPVVLDYFFEP